MSARLILAGLVLAFAAATAHAEDASSIAASGTGAVPACAACHGAHGEGSDAAPRLAGLDPGYLQAQLAAFADGTRSNETMTPVAQGLSPDMRSALAAYYGALPAPVAKRARESEAGRELAQRGDWASGLPACESCHGPGGLGVGATFPALAGQPATYIAHQLDDWRSGTRHNDPMALMATIAKRLSAAQIGAVANYFGNGPAAPETNDSSGAPPAPGSFTPPPESSIPAGPLGDAIREGEHIFVDTQAAAPQFTGNALACANCHLDAGRLANSAPLRAAYVAFPAYHHKEGRVITFAERLQGCFRYSMNGAPPPLGDKVLVALQTYAAFLAQGAPVGRNLPGRGYPRLPVPQAGMDYERGAAVYGQKCALCHGAGGAGQTAPRGMQVFPPLWGPHSYNWGAGMSWIDAAAGFIKANMPFSQGGSLTDQEAWDVALFVDSHERPQDPRYQGSVAETRANFHNSPLSMYGKTINGVLLGQEAK